MLTRRKLDVNSDWRGILGWTTPVITPFSMTHACSHFLPPAHLNNCVPQRIKPTRTVALYRLRVLAPTYRPSSLLQCPPPVSCTDATNCFRPRGGDARWHTPCIISTINLLDKKKVKRGRLSRADLSQVCQVKRCIRAPALQPQK